MRIADGHNDQRAALRRWAEYSWFFVVAACLMVCVTAFVWAAPRGYDISDDAYHLVVVADPRRYRYTLSEFGSLWHPLYLFSGGSVGALRDLGLVVLCGCSLAFGLAIARFSFPKAEASVRYAVVATVMICAFWEFETGTRTPSYNELNLSALLVFMAALFAMVPRSTLANSNIWRGIILPGVTAGAALALIVLAKPTSGVLTTIVGLVFVWLICPASMRLAVMSAAITACLVVIAIVVAIDGSVLVFAHRKIAALALLRERGTDGGIHHLGEAIYGPFLPGRRWKILPALGLGLSLFAMYCAAFAAQRLDRKLWRHLVLAVVAVATCVLTAWWRALSAKYPGISPAFHSWYFALFLVLPAAVSEVWRHKIGSDSVQPRRVGFAATLVAVMPFAYSFGTDTAIIRQMTEAAVFWAASALLVTSLAEPVHRKAIVATCAVLCSAATVGMFGGMLMSPNRIGQPMWHQTVPILIGPHRAEVMVDTETADYFATLRRAALAHGIMPETRIIDLSGLGPGVVYALAAVAPGVPWLHVGGKRPTAFARKVLSDIPRRELQCAWLITGSPATVQHNQIALRFLGLEFPNGYQKIASAERSKMGWMHTIWKPAGHRLKCA